MDVGGAIGDPVGRGRRLLRMGMQKHPVCRRGIRQGDAAGQGVARGRHDPAHGAGGQLGSAAGEEGSKWRLGDAGDAKSHVGALKFGVAIPTSHSDQPALDPILADMAQRTCSEKTGRPHGCPAMGRVEFNFFAPLPPAKTVPE